MRPEEYSLAELLFSPPHFIMAILPAPHGEILCASLAVALPLFAFLTLAKRL